MACVKFEEICWFLYPMFKSICSDCVDYGIHCIYIYLEMCFLFCFLMLFGEVRNAIFGVLLPKCYIFL